MSNSFPMSYIPIEETAKAYDNDYIYAPVGMFVLPIWLGSLALGLAAFALNVYVAKGFGSYIVDGQRSWFKSDITGVKVGVECFVLLMVLSLALALVGRIWTLKKRNIDPLWLLAKAGVPGFVLLVGLVLIFVNR